MSLFLLVGDNDDIPDACRSVGEFLRLQKLNWFFAPCRHIELLIGMWIDPWMIDAIPGGFDCTMSLGGMSVPRIKFEVSASIGLEGRWAILWLTIDEPCGALEAPVQREALVRSLIECEPFAWCADLEATGPFAPIFDVHDPRDFIRSEVSRLRALFPGVIRGPLICDAERGTLLQFPENGELHGWRNELFVAGRGHHG